MQYKSAAVLNSCTIGIQNGAASQGFQAAFNQSYLQPNFSIRLTPASWLQLGRNAGLIPRGNNELVELILDPAGGFGTNRATILITTGDPVYPLVTIPVELDVTRIATWRQTYFGNPADTGNGADNADPDGDGLVNLLEYAFNTNPNVANGSPMSYAIVGGHLTITFKRAYPAPVDISYLSEVANDLVSGVWQSGPAFTTQSVTNNQDGTETVVVTDNQVVGSATARYLRVRISRP